MNSDTNVGEEAPIRFNGVPSNVAGLVQGHFDQVVAEAKAVRISAKELTLGEFLAEQPYLRMARVGTTATRVRFSLPQYTPAGVYWGTIEIGGVLRPIEVTVEGRASFTISPARSSLTATVGGETTVMLTIVNIGNAVGEVPPMSSLDLVDPEALPIAFVAMVRGNETKSGLDRINQFADELHRHWGGLLRLKVLEGSGPIAPGEMRNVIVHLQLPGKLVGLRGEPRGNLIGGQSYRAEWQLAGMSYIFELEIPAAGPRAPNPPTGTASPRSGRRG